MGFPNRNANKFPAKAVKMFPDKNVVKNPERVATKNQNKVAQPFTSAKSANKPNTVVKLAFSFYDLFPFPTTFTPFLHTYLHNLFSHFTRAFNFTFWHYYILLFLQNAKSFF